MILALVRETPRETIFMLTPFEKEMLEHQVYQTAILSMILVATVASDATKVEIRACAKDMFESTELLTKQTETLIDSNSPQS